MITQLAIKNIMKIVRTKYDGVYREFKSGAWGSYYSQVADELATIEKPPIEIQIIDNFPKLPSNLWGAIINLYFDYSTNTALEAQVLLLRDEETLSKWKVVVPEQTVTATSVKTPNFNKCCDILTGEEYTSFPPDGYVHAGSSHSHSTMPLDDFSAIDDANELSCPGFHVVISHINTTAKTYKHTGSIVLKKKRYYVNASELVDTTPNNTPYHPIVKSYIKLTSLFGKIQQPWKTQTQIQNWKVKETEISSDLFNTNIGYEWGKDVEEVIEDLITQGYSSKELKSLIDKIEDKIFLGYEGL